MACSSSSSRPLASASSASAALAQAARGPTFEALQKALASSPPPAEDWAFHGEQLTLALTESATPADAIDAVTAARVYHLYVPIYFFCREAVRAHRLAGGRGALAIGLSAPQGCGKTTLTNALVERFAADGLTCAVASIDDFYLPGAALDAVGAAQPDNPLLQVRGNAGTHDLELGVETLRQLKAPPAGADGADGATGTTGEARTSPLRIPRYDKAARGGRGDRALPDAWTSLEAPPDVILFEGWMAGFAPLPPDAPVLAEHAGLPEVNGMVAAYSAWHALMDAWVVLAVDDPNHVYAWRLQAEQAMAAAGRPGMSDAQVADFVSRYMPAYRAYLPGLYAAAAEGGGGVDGKPTFMVHMDESRAPVAPPP